MSGEAVRKREWDHWPEPDGEEFTDKDGHVVLGWHRRTKGQDAVALLAEFQAFHDHLWGGQRIAPLLMRPILTRIASDVECRIHGWEEGSFVRCTERAKNPTPMWQIEVDDE